MHTLEVVDRGETEWIYLVLDKNLGSWDLHRCIMDPDHNRQRVLGCRILVVNRV